MKIFCLILSSFLLFSCKKGNDAIDPPSNDKKLYFPPNNSSEWATTTIESLNWNASAANDLYEFLSQNGTRAFIVLKDGKIVIEKYWGNNITNAATFDKDTYWYWASAGKTLTAVLVGIAQEEGFLDINDKTSEFLGNNWTSLALEKENLISIKHQLTMTTGLDYEVPNLDCTEPSCLQFKADAGTQWYYHNAPYTLLHKVVANASGMDFKEFTDIKIKNPTGMNGHWLTMGDNIVFWSTARSAARFGLLFLNNGVWNENVLLSDKSYLDAITKSSQNLNPSYGYLTWLNGKSSIIFPGLPTSFNISLSSHAPPDLYAALGKNGQFIDIVPGENLIVIRMGEAPDNAMVPVTFHDDMWKKINAVKN